MDGDVRDIKVVVRVHPHHAESSDNNIEREEAKRKGNAIGRKENRQEERQEEA